MITLDDPKVLGSERVVVIVGASSGIGLATALMLAKRGDSLVLAARGMNSLEAVADRCAELGARVTLVQADASVAADMRQVAAAAYDRFGRLDGWVHTAAVMAYGDMTDVPTEVTSRVLDTNVMGVVHAAAAVLPEMRNQGFGTFVVTGSLLGAIATPLMGPYVTSKWAVHGLVRVLQIEQRPFAGVDVCLVSPGAVRTPIYQAAATYVGRHGSPAPPVDKPDKVAAAIVGVLDRPKHRTSVGMANHLFVTGFRLLPSVFDVLVTPLVRRLALARGEVPKTSGNVFEPQTSNRGGNDEDEQQRVALSAQR